MTRDEAILRFRGRMLLHLTEAWAVRKLAPSDLGRVIEQHHLDAQKLIGEIWDAAQPEPPRKP